MLTFADHNPEPPLTPAAFRGLKFLRRRYRFIGMKHDHLTVAEVAAKFRVTPARIRQLCIVNAIGVRRGLMRFLSHEDVARLESIRRPPGRPKKNSEKSVDKPKRRR